MSTDEKGTPTPQKVINLATEQVALPKLTLLGTFGSLTRSVTGSWPQSGITAWFCFDAVAR